MAVFGKRQKEESINDKMVRLFDEGKSVHEISMELEVKPDVITNVIRRRRGEDSIPDTVIRSKNALPHQEEAPPLKAEAPAAAEPAPAEAQSTDGMSKLEKLMFEKEKKRQEEAEKAEEQAAEPVDEVPTMDAVSMDGISLDDLGTADPAIPEPVYAEPAPEAVEAVEEPVMDAVPAEEIPELAPGQPIEEHPINEYESAEPVAEPAYEEPAPAPAPVFEDKTLFGDAPAKEVAAPAAEPAPAHAAAADVHVSGSAFDKMKAFALAQVEANNAKIAELEQKLGAVEGDYQAQLDEAEKAVEESKVKYEDVITRSEELDEQRSKAQTEHRAAIARAEEEYRRKLAEVDDEYNTATAQANKALADKEAEINVKADAVDVEKENAKNTFLDNQSKVNAIKDKITAEVDTVKAQIESIKEENKGYESFM